MLVRTLSALVGISFIYGAWYFFSNEGLKWVCSLATLVACAEYSHMIEPKRKAARNLLAGMTFSLFLIFSNYSQSTFIFLGFFTLTTSYFILFNKSSLTTRLPQLNLWILGLVYCGILPGIVTLGVTVFNVKFFISLFLVSFLTDTFAYLGGRAYGKNPLSPLISPNKTLEGSLYGLLGGSISAFFYLNSLEHSSTSVILALACISASLFSQMGDLFESMLKRFHGVKDSGKIMPGHGGVLDRIDGLLFAAPIIYLWMQFYT